MIEELRQVLRGGIRIVFAIKNELSSEEQGYEQGLEK
jgi:hypothetical protein